MGSVAKKGDDFKCEDLPDEKKLIPNLYCTPAFMKEQKVISKGFNADLYHRISFSSFADNVGVGYWNKERKTVYPATIRVWQRDESENIIPFSWVYLPDLTMGAAYFETVPKRYELQGQALFEFKNNTSIEKCLDSLTPENCYFQRFTIISNEQSEHKHFLKSYHFTILAEKKEAADLVQMEGLFIYKKEDLEREAEKRDYFKRLIHLDRLYFQMLKVVDVLWMRLFYLDADGNIIAGPSANSEGAPSFEDLTAPEGVCQKAGEKNFSKCPEKVLEEKYHQNWVGKEDFPAPSIEDQSAIFEDVPGDELVLKN